MRGSFDVGGTPSPSLTRWLRRMPTPRPKLARTQQRRRAG